MPELNKKNLLRIFWCVCGAIILYWILHETDRVKQVLNTISGMVAPFVFGGVLAFILNVPMRAIESGILKKANNRKWKRVISVVLTFIALLLVVALVFWLLIPQIVSAVNSLIPNMYRFLTDAEGSVMVFLQDKPKVMQWLVDNTNFENISWSAMVEKVLSFFGDRVSTIVSGTISAISSIFSGLFSAVIGVVFCVYCLFQKENLARQGRKLLYAFLRESTADHIVRILRLTNSTFSNFLSGQCVEVCILGSMFAICMAIFRMPYIPLISVVIAVTAFIPIVGAWAGCILGAFLILVVNPMLAVWFVVMFLVIQQVENSMIYPRVVGTSVGLNGMWVLVAVSIGGKLMGVFGMFLMIPLVSVLYTLLQEVTNKRLKNTPVDPAKLQPQPPELISKFREKRMVKKEKRRLKLDALKLNKQNKE